MSLNFEGIGEEVAQVVIHNSKIPKKIYLASDKEIPQVQNGFLKFEVDEPSKIEPSWNKTLERMIWYISGMSGSGKSYFAGQLLKKYKKLYPKNEIFIFSSVNEDKSLDSLKVNRINLEGLLNEDLQSDDFANSIVIFDDCDCITNKNIKNKVLSIQNQILEKGRHNNVSCIVTSHVATDGTSTKKILNESVRLVIFPANANGRTLKYLLENYLGFDKHQIKYMKDLKTRPLTICKTYPQLVISDNMISFSKNLLNDTN